MCKYKTKNKKLYVGGIMRLRLPESYWDKKILIDNIITKATQDAPLGIKYILDDTLTALIAFIAIFTAAINDAEAKLKARMKETGEQTPAFKKLKTTEMDLIQVAKKRIERNDEPTDNLRFYAMNLEGEGPNPTSMDDMIKVALQLITGDAEAVAAGFPAMLNPSALELQTALDTARNERSDVKEAETAYDRAQQVLSDHGVTADDHIRECVDEMKFGLRHEDDSSFRRIMRTYGFKYESEPGEELPEKPVNFFVVWDQPDAHISCDPVPDAEGYLVQYSVDQVNWVELYDGQAESYTYQPPAGLRYYRMRAYNEYGDGEWSDVASFEPPVE